MNKKTLYQWHKRLGLTLGFILLVLAVSGVVITYRDELLPIVYTELKVEPQVQRASLFSQIEAAKAFLIDQPFTHLYTAERDDTASMFFYKPQGAYLPHLLAIDPYTSEIKGTMPLAQNIFGIMLYLHANLLLGKTGSWIVGLMGLLLTFFFITGIILWWPKQNWLQKLQQLPKSGVRGLHRGLGIFFGLPLVFSALTGFILAFDLLQPIGRALGDQKKPEDMSIVQACNYEEQIQTLNLLTPEQQKNLVSIHFCSPKNGFMKFSFGHHERSGHDGYVKIIADPRTQKIVQKFDTSKDPSSWSANALLVYPMHTGAYFGGLGRVLIFLCGLALAAMYFTGLWPLISKKLAMRKVRKIKNNMIDRTTV